MARFKFGGTVADFLIDPDARGLLRLVGGTLTMWSAQVGGTQQTNLLLNGSPVTVIVVPADGQVPEFEGPDEVAVLWADAGEGRVKLASEGRPGPGSDITGAEIAAARDATFTARDDAFASAATFASFVAESGAWLTVVNHGAVATFVRPAVSGPVMWMGSVTPNNSIAGDIESIVGLLAAEPAIDYLASFTGSSLTGTLSDLAAVATWGDDEGVYTLNQTTPGKRATFRAEAGAVPAYVSFDGVDDTFDLLNYGSLKAPPTSYVTAFRVRTAPAIAGTASILDGYDLTNRHRIYLTRPTSDVVLNVATGTTPRSQSPFTINAWTIVSWIHTGDSGSLFRVNGVTQAAGGTGTQSTQGFRLGANQAGTGQYAPMDLYAFRVLDASMSLAQIQAIEYALAARVGLVLP